MPGSLNVAFGLLCYTIRLLYGSYIMPGCCQCVVMWFLCYLRWLQGCFKGVARVSQVVVRSLIGCCYVVAMVLQAVARVQLSSCYEISLGCYHVNYLILYSRRLLECQQAECSTCICLNMAFNLINTASVCRRELQNIPMLWSITIQESQFQTKWQENPAFPRNYVWSIVMNPLVLVIILSPPSDFVNREMENNVDPLKNGQGVARWSVVRQR